MEINNNRPLHISPIFLTGIAVLLLGQIFYSNNGFISQNNLILLTFLIICIPVAILAFRFPFPKIREGWVELILYLGLILQIGQLIFTSPTQFIVQAYLQQGWKFKALIGLASICALLSLVLERWMSKVVRRLMTFLVIVFIFLGGVWVIKASPDPLIDVFVVHQTSAEALLNHMNPYELSEPNIYNDFRFYGPEWVENGRMTVGNPYPPLSIYLSSLGYFLAGDVRYSHLVALLISAALIGSFSNTRFSRLASYLLLFSPRLFYVIEQAWTEPILVMIFSFLIWTCIVHPKWRFVVFGLLLASKQYFLVMFPLAFLLNNKGFKPGDWIKPATTSIITAAFVTFPLAFTNFKKFVWDVGLAQIYQPFRLDTLSFLSAFTLVTGRIPPLFRYIPFGVLLLAILFALMRARHSPVGFSLSLAFCLIMFVAFSKQGNPNYYFMVMGVLASALSLLPLEISESGYQWPSMTNLVKKTPNNE